MATGLNQQVQFRTAIEAVIPHKETVDVASLADAVGASTSITVLGASLGDFVLVATSLSTQGITVTANVTAADTVIVRFQNESGGVIDLASQTVSLLVLKPGPIFSGL